MLGQCCRAERNLKTQLVSGLLPVAFAFPLHVRHARANGCSYMLAGKVKA
jgi:hypothetical protein